MIFYIVISSNLKTVYIRDIGQLVIKIFYCFHNLHIFCYGISMMILTTNCGETVFTWLSLQNKNIRTWFIFNKNLSLENLMYEETLVLISYVISFSIRKDQAKMRLFCIQQNYLLHANQINWIRNTCLVSTKEDNIS